jgi:hypothetical protein
MNDIMAHIKPSLNLAVENRLLSNKGKFKANLVFETIDDFHPANLIKQIPTLASLYESRVNLKDLLSKMDGNDELEDLLFKIMQDPKMQDTLMLELESESPAFKNAASHEQTIAQETMVILSEVKVSQDVSRDEIHHETELFESPYADEKQAEEIISDVSLIADDVSHMPEKQDKTDSRKNTNDFF